MASGPITSWQMDGEKLETVADFIFLGSKITADGYCSHEIERCLLSGRKDITNPLLLLLLSRFSRVRLCVTRQTFVGKVMNLLFNILSRLVTAFLKRSKCLLISWLQLPSAVISEAKKLKFLTVSMVSPPICHEVMGLDAMIFIF